MSASRPVRPASVPLSGADVALLAMSDGMRARLGHDASCRLMLRVAGHVDPDALGMRLKISPTWRWLTSLRLGRGPDRRPAWVVTPDAPEAGLRLYHRADDTALWDAVASAEGQVGDPRHTPVVRLDLHHVGDETSAIVLTWHHAALDARGAELLMEAIATDGLDDLGEDVIVGAEPARDEGLWARLMLAKKARDFLIRIGLGSVAFVGPRRPLPAAAPVWRRRVLDEAKTAAADARADDLRASLLRSAWHLVAVGRALEPELVSRGVRGRDLLVPVPQDRRRRGAKGPLLGNHISTLFYRLPREALADAASAVQLTGEQLKDRMKGGMPAAYLVLLDMVRGAPGWLLRLLIGLPTLGRVATFGFSDTGRSLDRLAAFRGEAVVEAVHLPANLAPPGLTVIVSRLRDRILLCASSLPDGLDADALDALLLRVEQELVGELG